MKLTHWEMDEKELTHTRERLIYIWDKHAELDRGANKFETLFEMSKLKQEASDISNRISYNLLVKWIMEDNKKKSKERGLKPLKWDIHEDNALGDG